jgi:hypothetical protein
VAEAPQTPTARRPPPLLIGLLVALAVAGIAVAGVFAYRLHERQQRRPPPPPRQTDVSLIAGWMTVPYVARRYRVPPEEIFSALNIPAEGNERRSLNDLAAADNRSSEEVVATVQAAVRDYQATHPAAKPGGPPGGAGSRGPPAAETPVTRGASSRLAPRAASAAAPTADAGGARDAPSGHPGPSPLAVLGTTGGG